MNTSFNASVTAFESGFTENLGAAIMNFALIEILCLLFSLFFRNFIHWFSFYIFFLYLFFIVFSFYIINITQTKFLDQNLSIVPLADKSNITISLVIRGNIFIMSYF